MAQNTALMEAINKFDNLNPYHVFTAQEVVDMLTELLPKERKDIEEASQPAAGYSLQQVADAFEAGAENEYEKHFGAIPPLSLNKETYLASLQPAGNAIEKIKEYLFNTANAGDNINADYLKQTLRFINDIAQPAAVADEAGEVYVWVKASERLPVKKYVYTVRCLNAAITGGEAYFNGKKFEWIIPDNEIEWLSLHPSQPAGNEAVTYTQEQIITALMQCGYSIVDREEILQSL